MLSDVKKELNQKSVDVTQLEKNLKIKEQHIKEIKNELETTKKEFDTKIADKTKEIETFWKEKTEEAVKQADEEYDQAIVDMQKEVENIVNQLDEKVGDSMRDMIAKHTLYFQCACSKNPAEKIPCYIDFTVDSNEFQCKKCGAVYRIDLNATPILLTRTIDESVLAEEIEKQLSNKFN